MLSTAMTRAATPATETLYLQIAEYGTASHIERLVRLQRRAEKLRDRGRDRPPLRRCDDPDRLRPSPL